MINHGLLRAGILRSTFTPRRQAQPGPAHGLGSPGRKGQSQWPGCPASRPGLRGPRAGGGGVRTHTPWGGVGCSPALRSPQPSQPGGLAVTHSSLPLPPGMLAREWPSALGASPGPLDTGARGAPPLLPRRGHAQTRPRPTGEVTAPTTGTGPAHRQAGAGTTSPPLGRQLRGQRVRLQSPTRPASPRSAADTPTGPPQTPKTQTRPRGGLPPSQTSAPATGRARARAHTRAHTSADAPAPRHRHTHGPPRAADPHAESKAVTRPHPEHIPPLGCVWVPLPGPRVPPIPGA